MLHLRAHHLRLGVLQAQGVEAAARRLSTYQLAQRFEPLGVDEAVCEAWALLVSRLRAAGRKAPINDSWIAATAIVHDVPIVTQDNDYDVMLDVEVIKIQDFSGHLLDRSGEVRGIHTTHEAFRLI